MVEGGHAVRDLLTRYPEQILTIVAAHGYLQKEGQSDRLVRLASSTKQYSCSDPQFSKLSDLDAPQGILAVVRQPTWDEGEVLRQPTVLGILENSYKILPMLGPLFERRQRSMRVPCGLHRTPLMCIIPRWFVRRAGCCSRYRSLSVGICQG